MGESIELSVSASETDDTPLFVNKTRMTREKYFEAVTARGKYGKNLFFRLAGPAAAVLGLTARLPGVAALGLIVALASILSPGLLGRRDYRRLCQLHPEGEWDKTVRFYRDRVETETDSGCTSVPYGKIRHEAETEHMYILEFDRSTPATTFDKSGFTKGTLEDMKRFVVDARRGVAGDGEKNG